MKTLFFSIATALLLFAAGCGSREETGEGSKPTLKLEGKTLDEQIAAVEADPTIPPQYKETYIKSLRDKAAATTGGGGSSAPQ